MISIGRSLSLPALGTRLPDPFHHPCKKLIDYRRRPNLTLVRAATHINMDARGTLSRPPSSSSLILTSGASSRVSSLLSLNVFRALMALVHAFVFLLLAPFLPRRPRSVAVVAEKQDAAVSERKAVVVRVPRREKEASIRRAMAIKRVKLDDEGDCDRGGDGEGGRSVRDFALFRTVRGDTLFTQSWCPVNVPAKGLVLLLHGLNEHSSRYNHFAKQLNSKGFKVYGMDWIGHGGSDGLHGYVPSLDYAVNDLKSFLEKTLNENPGLPCFCFGHSTGGAIVLKAALDRKVGPLIRGIILTSPAVGVQPAHPLVAVFAPIISLIAPRYQLSDEDKKGMPVSRDPKALVAKYSDPLVFTGSIRVRTGTEILRITDHLQQNLSKVNVPFLVLHGTADTVTDPSASRKLYEEASSVDKSIKLYEGYLHDLLFEPERDDISRDIIDWLSSRVE